MSEIDRARLLVAAWRELVKGAQGIGGNAKASDLDAAASYWRGFCVALNGAAGDLERVLGPTEESPAPPPEGER